jgi:hypothetical protein
VSSRSSAASGGSSSRWGAKAEAANVKSVPAAAQ